MEEDSGTTETMTTLTCPSDFWVAGNTSSSDYGTMWRMVMMLITASLLSSWVNLQKVKRLQLFFAHYASGLIYEVSQLVTGSMVYVCWADNEHAAMLMILKFVEMVAVHMLALTAMCFCINLVYIVASHHENTPIKSVGTPRTVGMLLLISVLLTTMFAPFWKEWAVTRSLLWAVSENPGRYSWIILGYFITEFIVGIIMAIIVASLLLFRKSEVLESWAQHRRFRFYAVFTGIAVVGNIIRGIMIFSFMATGGSRIAVFAVFWNLRHLHIALDTLVMYKVLDLSSRGMDERGGIDGSSEEATSTGASAPTRYQGSNRWEPQNSKNSTSGGAGSLDPKRRMASAASVTESVHEIPQMSV